MPSLVDISIFVITKKVNIFYAKKQIVAFEATVRRYKQKNINYHGLEEELFLKVIERDGINSYLREQISKGNLVRIKKRNTQAGESTTPIVAHYGENVSNNSISQNSDSVNQNSENSQKLHQLRAKKQQRDRWAREYLKRRYPMPSLVDISIFVITKKVNIFYAKKQIVAFEATVRRHEP